MLAAACAGALNSVAGGGTFLTFPLLLASGVAAKPANATSTVALWPGAVSSAYGYRDVVHRDRHLGLLATVSAVGGLVGSLLLLWTSEATFRGLVPWLLAAATLVFAFGGRVTRRLRATRHAPDPRAPLWLALGQFGVAVYGGYFGAGIGILMLAALAAFGLEDLHAMNGLKNILGATINAVAILVFVAAGLVDWAIAPWMVVGSVVGGYVGSRTARKVPVPVLRAVVITVGTLLSAYYFVRG